MLTTPHALAGAAIGAATGNPVAGFALAVVSHYLLDAVPHTDPGTWHYGEDPRTMRLVPKDYIVGIADLVVAIGAVGWAVSALPAQLAPAVVVGAIGGFLPDSLVYLGIAVRPVLSWPLVARYNAFIQRFHYTARPDQFALGVFTQLAVALAAIGVLLIHR